jgi:integrating conjugative element protein (TIGR03757 family)
MKLMPLLFSLCLAAPTGAEEYTVFTATFLPAIQLNGVKATVYIIDQPALILNRLAYFQTSGRVAAEDAARAMLNSASGKALLGELEASFNGVVAAWSHSIERLPAILVDDQYVLYGVFDLDEASAVVRRFKASKP